MDNIERFDAALRAYQFALRQWRGDFPPDKLAALPNINGSIRDLVVDVARFFDFAAETHVPALVSWRKNFGQETAFEIPLPPWIDDELSAVEEQREGSVETWVQLSEDLAWRLIQASVLLDYLEQHLLSMEKVQARQAKSVDAAVVDGNTVRKQTGKSLSSGRRAKSDPFLLVDQFNECKKKHRADWVAYITCHAVLGCELISRFASALSKLTTFVKIVSK
ncbi:hypothetical protein GR198_05840 [Rhizobium leguminosarum]|uniref:hypothetical protein n=1 Tax=Rhizobium leguminosarum TaxID=384 RepID=UPI0013BF42DB|nr:hypothetical protein [Rhizobium leguminosarum]NEH55267.1 hypothetical protein [Rhizobium leguminosarum]